MFVFCAVVEDYIVVANATSYSVTMVTASSLGSVDIPFTVTFQLQHYNETFFRPTGHILLTVNISTNSDDNDTAVFHFDDDTVARVHTSAANNGFTFLDHINAGDTLVLQDIIIFSFDLSTRVTEPRTFNFFAELYSGDCIGCVGSGVVTVDRTPLFQGAVTIIPALPDVEKLPDIETLPDVETLPDSPWQTLSPTEIFPPSLAPQKLSTLELQESSGCKMHDHT